MGVGSEEGDGRLRGGEQQAPLLHPGDDIRGMIGQGVRRHLRIGGGGRRREIVRVGGDEGGGVGI